MKLKLLTAVATTALMAVPTIASAQDTGWYLRGNMGYGIHNDMDISGDLVGDVESQGNLTGSVGLGYEFANNWRLELDGASLFTDAGKISQLPNSFAKLRTTTAMLNAIYDFDDFARWEPYVGAGIGLVRGRLSAQASDFPSALPITSSVVSVNSPACPNSTNCSYNDGDTALGWQLLAGLGYKITDNFTWDTQYRYLNSGNFEVTGVDAANNYNVAQFEGPGAHSLMTGFRYRFGGKAEPVMVSCWDGSQASDYASCPERPVEMKTCWDGSSIPVADTCPAEPVRTQRCWNGSEIPVTSTCPPEPQMQECWDGSLVSDLNYCPQRTRSGVTTAELCANPYRSEIIYYEFNKGQSAETRNAINRILDVGQFCNVDNIRVVGHTDTSGSAAYNLQLSKRRAKDARDELVRQGINSAVITSEGKGETEPQIPTGDGVKEQLNRRTEVLIQLSSVGAR